MDGTHWIDLTRTVDAQTPVYPGDPPLELRSVASFEADGYYGSWMASGLHVGTHVDAPRHFVKAGALVSELPLDRYFGRGVLIDAGGQTSVGDELLRGQRVERGDIVLVFTGWSARYGTPDYFQCHPAVSPEFARALVASGVSMLGVDMPSPDHAPYPVHQILLSAGVLIIENLCQLEVLVGAGDFEVIALPGKFEAEAAPVRVVARCGR